MQAWGRAGWGVGRGSRIVDDRAERASHARHLSTPTPIPSPQGGGEAHASTLQPPPDNSCDRRADFSNAHRARKSTQGNLPKGWASGRNPATSPKGPADLDPELADALGYGDSDPTQAADRRAAAEDRDELADIFQSQREKRHRPMPQPMTLGVTASMQALEHLLREGRDGIPRPRRRHPNLDAAPAAAAGQIRRRPALRHQVGFRSQGRPADGDRRPGRRRAAQRPHPGAARRHRLRQDLHHGQGDRSDAAPGSHPGAEQDAGGAALRRVQEFLSRQRRRIFRHLLRLLPAGSLYPAHRHLYREGFLDQRADRPHAPLGDAGAARARRRHHRRLGVVHLRYRLGRDLFGDDVLDQARRAAQPAAIARRSGGAAIQAHRRRFLSRLVPRARRRHRDFPGALRGPRLAGVAVRRRGGIDPRIRSAHRAKDRRAGIRQDLRQFALCDAAADAVAGDVRHKTRIARAARTSSTPPAACSKRSGSSSARCTIWK